MVEIYATCVGNNFRPAPARERIKALVPGEQVLLEAEPSNPYDSNAVKVITEDGEFVGYLSRESNAETAAHLAEDGDYKCEVVSFLSATKPHLCITLISDGFADETDFDAD